MTPDELQALKNQLVQLQNSVDYVSSQIVGLAVVVFGLLIFLVFMPSRKS